MEQRKNGEVIWKFWQRRRHVVALLAFLGFFNVYSLRVNLSVAIVAMTTPYIIKGENGTEYEVKDFEWDSKTQGLVLGSFFYGYICTQLLGGWLAAKVGGTRVFPFGICVTALLTLITPPIVNSSVYFFIGVRIVEGLFEGVTYPCIHDVWSKWAPPSERSTIASFAFSGSFFGTVVALPVCGLIANSWGWPYVFYITGVVGLLWCALWWIIVKDNPIDDPKITQEELKYLQRSLGYIERRNILHPWSKMLKSTPVWAIVTSHFCENWGYYTLLTQLPTFMKDTFDFDLGKAGFLSSLPYLVMTIIMQFAGRLADILINRKILTRTNVRKLFNCGAFLIQACFMMTAAYLLTPEGVVTCLILAVGLGAFAWPGFSVNHLDIAPRHASVLMGLSNTFATLPGMISPVITGYIVTNKQPEEWKVIFYISATLYLIGSVFYGAFASAEEQSWSRSGTENEKNNKQESNQTIRINFSIPDTNKNNPKAEIIYKSEEIKLTN